jgi:large subunit ribosomal protein L10
LNRDQKAAVIDEVAGEISGSDAIFAVDYRGISVPQAAELRTKLRDADAHFRVVKNTLTERAADQAGAEGLKALLEGPTAMTFVRGDAAAAAKALRDFRRASGGQLLEFKGGWMNGASVSPQEIDAIAQLPSREVLYGRLVGMVASPLTGLASALGGLIGGLARQLQQMADEGLVGGDAPAAAAPAEPAAEEPAAEAPAAEEPAAEAPAAEEPAAEEPAAEEPAAEESAAEPTTDTENTEE